MMKIILNEKDDMDAARISKMNNYDSMNERWKEHMEIRSRRRNSILFLAYEALLKLISEQSELSQNLKTKINEIEKLQMIYNVIPKEEFYEKIANITNNDKSCLIVAKKYGICPTTFK